MAKMFYTIEEVCQKLGKSNDEINEMVSSGQIQEFRDGEKLIFKVEQIDLLIDPEDSGSVELDLSNQGTSGMDLNADSNAGFASGEHSEFDIDSPAASAAGASSTGSMIDLTGSATGMPHELPSTPPSSASMGSGTGSGLAFDLSGSASGVSAFGGGGDAGETQLGEELDEDLTLESVGSGSGLLDLTRESDDTSLGAELLEEVYSGEDEFELPANASGLFEAVSPAESSDPATPAAAPTAAAPMAMMEEAYDGAGSGLSVGLSIGALVAMIVLLVILASEIEGAASGLTNAIAGNLWIWTGGLAVGAIIAAGVGLFIGRASE